MEEGVKTEGNKTSLHSPQRGKTVAWPVFCSICFFSSQEDIEEGVCLFRQSLGLCPYICQDVGSCQMGMKDLVRPCLAKFDLAWENSHEIADQICFRSVSEVVACGNSDMWFWYSINHQGWIRFPSEVSKTRRRSLGRSGDVKHLIMGGSGIPKWQAWHHLPVGRCRLGGVGLACGFCQSLCVTYQGDIPQSRRGIELSFEALSKQYSQDNHSRELSNSIQSVKSDWRYRDQEKLVCLCVNMIWPREVGLKWKIINLRCIIQVGCSCMSVKR